MSEAMSEREQRLDAERAKQPDREKAYKALLDDKNALKEYLDGFEKQLAKETLALLKAEFKEEKKKKEVEGTEAEYETEEAFEDEEETEETIEDDFAIEPAETKIDDDDLYSLTRLATRAEDQKIRETAIGIIGMYAFIFARKQTTWSWFYGDGRDIPAKLHGGYVDQRQDLASQTQEKVVKWLRTTGKSDGELIALSTKAKHHSPERVLERLRRIVKGNMIGLPSGPGMFIRRIARNTVADFNRKIRVRANPRTQYNLETEGQRDRRVAREKHENPERKEEPTQTRLAGTVTWVGSEDIQGFDIHSDVEAKQVDVDLEIVVDQLKDDDRDLFPGLKERDREPIQRFYVQRNNYRSDQAHAEALGYTLENYYERRRDLKTRLRDLVDNWEILILLHQGLTDDCMALLGLEERDREPRQKFLVERYSYESVQAHAAALGLTTDEYYEERRKWLWRMTKLIANWDTLLQQKLTDECEEPRGLTERDRNQIHRFYVQRDGYKSDKAHAEALGKKPDEYYHERREWRKRMTKLIIADYESTDSKILL